MSPSFNSFGSNPSVSQLVWDTDLIIPDGKAIESASGDVAINSNGTITAEGNITSTANLVGVNAVLSGKELVFGENVGNASLKLPKQPSTAKNYTSPDLTITDGIVGVQYIVPPINFYAFRSDGVTGNAVSTFTLEGKLSDGTYTPVTSVTVTTAESATETTPQAIIPGSVTALRYTTKSNTQTGGCYLKSNSLSLTLTPIPVY